MRPSSAMCSAAASTFTSIVRAAMPWSRVASIVASGIVLTVSGPISVST